jgi:flagellar hook-associated protein 2
LGLRFDPMGGGQFKQAVKAIIEAESQPIKQLEARKGREEAKLKLFQDFKSKFSGVDKALQEISTFKKMRELKVDLGDGTGIASVTVDKDRAQPGSYTIQVDQLAARTSVISNGFSSPDEPVLGMGFVVMNLPDGETAEVYVDEDRGSLRGVADLINGSAKCPVRAAVIKDSSDLDEPWKLILSAKKDGDPNNVVFPDFYFMDGEQGFYIDDSRDAQNARLTMDGFEVELESNDVNDFLPGVNLHLKQARPEQPFTLTISEDYQKVSGKIKNLVDQVNGVLGFIMKQNQVDKDTDTRTMFTGDTSLQTVEYRLRNLMHEGFPVADETTGEIRLVHLNQLGVEFDKAGVLQFKEEKFMKNLEKDFEGISEAISGDFGLAFQMKELMATYTQSGTGLLANRESGIRSRIRDIDNQIENRTRILDRRQQNLTDQFSRLQASLSKMQSQQQYLQANMGSAGGNILQQLMGG